MYTYINKYVIHIYCCRKNSITILTTVYGHKPIFSVEHTFEYV